mmetsp:Transcript_44797/g.133787  ORF Transcript_44797/g.133787 Transcript_44797/m.133787 type:complete len:206 (+) Transcript_44797:397-1014(+)
MPGRPPALPLVVRTGRGASGTRAPPRRPFAPGACPSARLPLLDTGMLRSMLRCSRASMSSSRSASPSAALCNRELIRHSCDPPDSFAGENDPERGRKRRMSGGGSDGPLLALLLGRDTMMGGGRSVMPSSAMAACSAAARRVSPPAAPPLPPVPPPFASVGLSIAALQELGPGPVVAVMKPFGIAMRIAALEFDFDAVGTPTLLP